MTHDEEAASPRWKLNTKNFCPDIVRKICRVRGKTRVSWVSGNDNFLGLISRCYANCLCVVMFMFILCIPDDL